MTIAVLGRFSWRCQRRALTYSPADWAPFLMPMRSSSSVRDRPIACCSIASEGAIDMELARKRAASTSAAGGASLSIESGASGMPHSEAWTALATNSL